MPLFLAQVFDFEELHMLNRHHGMGSPAAGLAAGLAATLAADLAALLVEGLAALGAGWAAGLAGAPVAGSLAQEHRA